MASIKYKDPITGNMQQITMKVADTLPVGTEVDYDGETVPAGWEEVDETKLGDVVVDSIRTKNMFDGVTTNAYIDSSGVLQNASDWVSSLNYLPVKANTTYIVSATNMGARFIYAEYDSSRAVIGTRKEITPSTPFTTSSTTKYVRFCTNNANVTNIQLEEGSTATPYTPYQELNNQEVYSTTETRIGTWIDGKPLYRKVVYMTLPSDSGYHESSSGISNIGTIMLSGKSYIENTIYRIPLNSSTANPTYSVWLCPKTDGKVAISGTGTSVQGKTTYLILEYTKTTD